ncbi:MAG: MFS transporter [Chloroflexota bacterium]
MRELAAIFKNRNLRLLLPGRFISTTGDWLYQIALSVAIFQYSHHSSLWVGAYWIVKLIPSLFLAPLGGTLAGRLGYRRAMIIADLARLILVLGLAAVLRSQDWQVIFPFAFLVTAFGRLFAPASVGLVPSLIDSKEQRLATNATIMQAESLAITLGSAAGGVVAALGWINQLLVIDAATFGLSALVLWNLRPRPAATEAVLESPEVPAGESETMEKGFVAGLRFLGKRPQLVFAASVMALPELASGALYVWLVPYSVQTLHLGNGGVGYMYAALGVGLLAGGTLAALTGGSIRLDLLLALSVTLGGIALVVFGVWTVAVVALIGVAVIGAAENMEYAAYETLLQQGVPDRDIGRASGIMDSFLFNMVFIGTAISGVMAAVLTVRFSLTLIGILIVAVTGVAWLNLRRQMEGRLTADGLLRIPAFSRLTEPEREWAVRRMVREIVPAGGRIVTQGEEGHTFYAIARGRAEVMIDDQPLPEALIAGDFFGEIALLHNVARTATVTALKPTTLWVMHREDFEELQERVATFKESLWDTANERQGRRGPVNVAPAAIQ